jgi:U3 small nucleolar RNA-associated protein MPP10
MAVAIAPLTNGNALLDPREDIVAALSTSSHSFLQPTSTLHTAAVLAAKKFLDPLASTVSEAQELRRRENRGKRKRSAYEEDVPRKVLQLREVYTEGFGIDQIWEQARRILDAATDEVERDLKHVPDSQTTKMGDEKENQQASGDIRMMQFDEDGLEAESDDEDDDLDSAAEDDLVDSLEGAALGEVEGEEMEDELDREDFEEDIEDTGESEDFSETEKNPQTYISDPNGLNDGFFSIDDFNKTSQFQEQQDAMGEEDNPSDEDEVDWDADPLTSSLPSKSLGKRTEAEDATDSEDGDEPTFGHADLDGASDDEDEDNVDLQDGMPTLDNTNDIQYADFFEPPPQKLSKSKRMRALPKTQPPPHPIAGGEGSDDINNDIQRAISDVRRDLLDSEDEPSSDDEEDDDDQKKQSNKPSTSTKNLSTHEKQRAKIASEIRRLEAVAISKRDWTLSGEARAADRPLNSLLEEDLEFERAGKPVPVITAEVSEEIEALIKRRIVAREFDEVLRRRPDVFGAAASAKRGRVELDDTKPSQGLADVYEAEHLKATDPGHVDKRSAALKKQHDEITRLWKDVSAKLDVLSNLHFKPKRTEVSVQVVNDKPTIRMEDARPGAVEGGAESMLAPHEIYMPGGEGKIKGEVVGKGGMARSKEEMTREEKVRRRRREKERAKKKKGNESVENQQQLQVKKKGSNAEKAQEKRNILDELRKGGVKVIGKKGDVEEIDGKKRKSQRGAEPRSTAYKL